MLWGLSVSATGDVSAVQRPGPLPPERLMEFRRVEAGKFVIEAPFNPGRRDVCAPVQYANPALRCEEYWGGILRRTYTMSLAQPS
jgi:hypothetical protein